MDNPASHSEPKAGTVSHVPVAEVVITLAYVLLGGLWIVFSDRWLEQWQRNSASDTLLQTYKGLNFIATTGVLLFFLLRRSFDRRRLAEEELRRVLERFELTARASNDAIWDWDLVTDQLWWGDGFQKLFGHKRGELEPTSLSWTKRLHPEDKSRIINGIYKVIKSDKHYWYDEYRFLRKDGSYAHVYDRGYVIRDRAGKAVRMVGGMSDVTERKQAEEELRRSGEQLRGLTARLQTLREEERTRMAREIHDELGQMLTGLKMDLRWIERKLGELDGSPSLNALLDKAVEAGELTDATIARVQKLAVELRPSVLDNLGLVSAIRGEAQRFQERTAISCALLLPESLLQLSPETNTAIFRIFQETLTNITRHAGASQVQVGLFEAGDQVVLEVRDNGKGIPLESVESSDSLGLIGMRERAAMLGGDITFARRPTGGTQVTLRLPRDLDEVRLAQIV
jgi:two-component system sensor histidine kinase UhpB